jgi:hypothetical protein
MAGWNSIVLRDEGSCDSGDKTDLLTDVLYFDLETGMSGFKNKGTIHREQQNRSFNSHQGSFSNVQLPLHDTQLTPENHGGYEAYHGESGRKNSDYSSPSRHYQIAIGLFLLAAWLASHALDCLESASLDRYSKYIGVMTVVVNYPIRYRQKR